LNSFSNGIIKNLFLNVNRQTEPLTFVFSSKGREELKGCPLTLTLSRKVEREEEK
jgi:hypothetical protein